MNNEVGFLRLPAVMEALQCSKSTIWAKCRKGEWPAPIKISERITVWRRRDIFELIEKLSGEKHNG